MYQTFLLEQKQKKLAPPREEPVAITPEAMNSMLVKETKEEALEKRMRRKSIVVQDVSATAPGNNNNNNFLYLGNAVISHSSPRPFWSNCLGLEKLCLFVFKNLVLREMTYLLLLLPGQNHIPPYVCTPWRGTKMFKIAPEIRSHKTSSSLS